MSRKRGNRFCEKGHAQRKRWRQARCVVQFWRGWRCSLPRPRLIAARPLPPRPKRARRLLLRTAAGSVTGSRARAASPGPSLRPIQLRPRRSRHSCAEAIAPCRPIPRPFFPRRTSPISTPTWNPFRNRQTTRAFRCSISRRTTPVIAGGEAYASPLQIKNQAFALAAGAADHDLGIRGLLLLGQNGVAMLGYARDHALLARSTDAELAGIVDVDPGIE